MERVGLINLATLSVVILVGAGGWLTVYLAMRANLAFYTLAVIAFVAYAALYSFLGAFGNQLVYFSSSSGANSSNKGDGGKETSNKGTYSWKPISGSSSEEEL
uniref:Orf102 n=1 Tax=Amoebidium parasiticum TaxID=4881 RepID=Q8M0B6_AMOPA|nr:Orf102 [Amoebidium parasiticum]